MEGTVPRDLREWLDQAFLVEVTALMADYPSNEQAVLFAVARSARIWEDLDRLGVPGIRGVWAHPAAAGGFALTVVSLEQRYAGHAPQVLAAQCPELGLGGQPRSVGSLEEDR
ncbi:MAG: hypothetical protein ACK45F_03405 [bacterium]